MMIPRLCLAVLLSALALTQSAFISGASAQTRSEAGPDAHGNLNGLVARHAAAHNVPESLVRRVIHRESRGNPRAISKGNYGLMQIRLGTARAMGYRGTVAGLLDADTNMTYAVKYLAGAYQVAGGNHDRAVRYYAAGYYYAAKRQGRPMPGGNQPTSIFAAATVEPAESVSRDRVPVEPSPTALSATK
ncbi:MAG: lytic transglycosylase domain-containing protein [Pseudolabrys sp.]|nr:lytic transglycosylase domain-containing protein [Pseudolabrys sp.]MDP2297872.1 lytic transglycosylase domain-containing protein [Pseudolabrys sp.]